MAKRWTEEDDALLVEFYIEEGATLCADVLDRTKSSVLHRASKLKLTTSSRWTPEEDLLLYNNYPEYGLDYCSTLIKNRTKVAIENRVSKLQIKRSTNWTETQYNILKEKYNILSIKEVAKLINKTEAAVMRKATKHNLCIIKQNVTKEELIVELQKYKPNNRRECDKIPEMHSSSTFSSYFGSWNLALKAANLPINDTKVSAGETELATFISKLHKDVLLSNRTIIKPLELDIVLPSLKVAIEYNGDYWHSTAHKDKNYHIDKTNKANSVGYQLIHIFENEWLYKQKIVKSRVRNLLGLSNKIYARKCSIKEVSTEEARNFQSKTHLQGFVGASVKLGLYFECELISLMTFGKPRYNSNYEYELLRFSTKLNTVVVGGASKLFKNFIKNNNPSSIISYSDIRWGTGALYRNLGFKLSHTSKPNYWYVKHGLLESRVKFQKHKLKDLLDNFIQELTEEENMNNNGYTRIYDCGNKVFIWDTGIKEL